MNDARAQMDLQRFQLVSALGEPQIRALEKRVRIREVKRRAVIYKPGDPSDQILLLRAGVVKIAAIGPGCREVILGFVSAGDVFGELAAVDDRLRDHLAMAREDCVICGIDRDLVRQAARQCPEFAGQFARLLAMRIRESRARIEEAACKTAQARVASALLSLANGHGVADARGLLIPLRLSQRDLANFAGLTRETVNIVLRGLRERGLIEADRCGFRLTNSDALRSDVR